MKADILIVDDSKDMLEVISRQLESKGYNTFRATNVLDAVDLLKLSIPKLLISDIQMPGVDGSKLVKYAQKHFPDLPVLVITGYPSIEPAVDVLQDGSIDFLIKPFTQEELLSAVDAILNVHDPVSNDESHAGSSQLFGIVGHAKSLDSTFHLIDRTKDNKVSVLITGESGTGKELVARAIHYGGIFREKPFVAVNCGAIPANLLEAELFGYEKGAFTGANTARDGFFLTADQGTIFLDEIANAPTHVQQSLLRVLQEKEITPVGSRNPIKVDVRIIAATNGNLQEMVEHGSFREDLYYRLNVVNIKVPPLRERKSDIQNLTDHFIRKHAEDLGKEKVEVSRAVMEVLKNYSWPGNIRELENVIQQALVVCDSEIELAHLPEYLFYQQKETSPIHFEGIKTLKEVELDHIKYVLTYCDNNKTKAAEILGITRKTLAKKLP